ncbi:VanZ family protein [Bowmanella yangjiangensis]|uniref:VanZ family protein n=1 Tax=Bowmanella yangjiangensis TaxID=2811230 RepID=A0ABS3CX76_9ALTE|nr:VanZ family protein [Bowmanella yangjiangensis]MBN7820239.1 VanZ family protein [Bowmanella yangjiangensis]
MKLKQKWTSSDRLAFVVFLTCLVVIAAKYIPGWDTFPKAIERWLGSDHYLHMLVGCGLSLALAQLFAIHRHLVKRQLGFFVILLVMYGVDELIQIWVPFRKFSSRDFGASALGWGIAVFCWFMLHWLGRTRSTALNR